MVCHAHDLSLATPDPRAKRYEAMNELAMKLNFAIEERRPEDAFEAPEARCHSSMQRQRSGGLAPVAMPGSLAGKVLDPSGLPVMAHILVRDHRRAVVRECYPILSRSGEAGVRFYAGGLPAGIYTLEVTAPGCCREVRHDLCVEASCVTDVGTLRLIWSDPPGVTARPRWAEIDPFVLRVAA
jgi:hypothetical protein